MAHLEQKGEDLKKKKRWNIIILKWPNQGQIVLKWPIQGHSVHSQCCATTTSLSSQNVFIKENSILIKQLLPIPASPAQGKHKSLCVSPDYWLVLNCKSHEFFSPICFKKNTVKSGSLWSIYFPICHIFQQ